MKKVRYLSRFVVGAVVVWICGNALAATAGYMARTWECGSKMATVYAAEPGYSGAGAARKLYPLELSKCTLPAQWGGDKEPLSRWP